MQDIVDKVLEMESAAEERVLEAKRRAAELKNTVDAEINAELARARAQAQKMVQEQIAQAKENADRSVEEAVARVEENNGRSVSRHQKLVEDAVAKIVSLVITPEYERG